jgi:hypothetical protein
MSPPNIRPLTIQELNALYRRLINNEGIPNVFSDIEYHKDEFVQPGAQEYIVRIRESINENELEQYSSRTITALRSLIRTKINPMEGLIPFDSIIPPVVRHGGRRRKHRKTRSKTRKVRSRR